LIFAKKTIPIVRRGHLIGARKRGKHSLFSFFLKPRRQKRRTWVMMVSKEQYITTTEFANRYNKTRPIDKNFMPLEPSFVKLLCDQGKLEHSTLPARDGRKNDVYMIPEHELETIDILLNADEAIEKKEPARTMSTNEVASFLNISNTYVAALVRSGKLKVADKVKPARGGRPSFVFNDDDVLKYYEENSKHACKHKSEHKIDIPAENAEAKQVEELTKVVKELRAEILKLVEDNEKLMDDNEKLMDSAAKSDKIIADLRSKLNQASKSANDKDIFEAYRHGFKDGFEMGGAH
jgi:regulator of replication initiation timing